MPNDAFERRVKRLRDSLKKETKHTDEVIKEPDEANEEEVKTKLDNMVGKKKKKRRE